MKKFSQQKDENKEKNTVKKSKMCYYVVRKGIILARLKEVEKIAVFFVLAIATGYYSGWKMTFKCYFFKMDGLKVTS